MHSSSYIKTVLRPLVPRSIMRMRGARIQRIRWELCRQLYEQIRGQIFTGPFAGMRYVDTTKGQSIGPQLLGTYECELHSAVDEIIASKPDTIVDVGAGEGYYAVGFLTRLPEARMIAFEADCESQSLIRQVSDWAHVTDRLRLFGKCADARELGAVLAGKKVVVMMDVEGMEQELLDPIACPALRVCSILVEVHDQLRPGCSSTLQQWYRSSHDIIRISTIGSDMMTLPSVPGLTTSDVRLLANELRPPMEWFWMVPQTFEPATTL